MSHYTVLVRFEAPETESEADWEAKFAERFLSDATDKTVVAIVDCHI